ncbi:DUF3397 domain-containing protein [Virgibacillus sp. FSP13]
MFDIVVYFIAFLITVPIIATWIVYQISVKIHRQKWRAIHTAVNWTTILYILAVTGLFTVVFNHGFFGWILIFLMMALSIIIFLQWKTKMEVEFKRAFKEFWRFSFLLFSFLYLCLVLIGLIQQVFFF